MANFPSPRGKIPAALKEKTTGAQVVEGHSQGEPAQVAERDQARPGAQDQRDLVPGDSFPREGELRGADHTLGAQVALGQELVL